MSRRFNGTTDRIDYPSPFDFVGKPITIIARVWCDTVSPGASADVIADFSVASGVGISFALRSTQTGALQFFRPTNSTSYRGTTGDNAVTVNRWNTVGVSNNGTMAANSTFFYANGRRLAQSAETIGAGTESAATGYLSLGGLQSADTNNFQGKIAWLSVHTRYLAHDEHTRIGSWGADPRTVPGCVFFVDYRTSNPTDLVGGATATFDGTSFWGFHRPLAKPWTPRSLISLFGLSAPVITGTSDTDTLIDESTFTISGTDLGSATSVLFSQSGRPDYEAVSLITDNQSTSIELTGLDVQDMGMAYGAATVSVTNANGTSASFPITIAKQASHLSVVLSGHTPSEGWALGGDYDGATLVPTADGDILVAGTTTTKGGTFAFVGTTGAYTITYPGDAPTNDTLYRARFDDSADQWYEGTVTINPSGSLVPISRIIKRRRFSL